MMPAWAFTISPRAQNVIAVAVRQGTAPGAT